MDKLIADKININIDIQIGKYQSFEGSSDSLIDLHNKSLSNLFKNISTHLSILDVGCGDGVALRWFKSNGFNDVEGIDANSNKLERAAISGCKLYTGDIHRMCDIISRKYDIIYCSHTLEHALFPELVIDNFKNILNYKGTLIIIIPYPDNGPDDAHCGKFFLKSNRTSTGAVDIIDVFKNYGFVPIAVEVANIREPEIFMTYELS